MWPALSKLAPFGARPTARGEIGDHGVAERELRERLARRVGEGICRAVPDPQVPLLVDQLRARHGEALAAVLFYGSCLFSETRTATSFYDFYLLTDDPLRFFGNAWQAALNAVLPPNVYHGRAQEADGAATSTASYKACVMTVAQFGEQTSPRADDIHHLGRFSKRIAVAYHRDPATLEHIVDGVVEAMMTLVPHALTGLPERFTLDELVHTLFSLSYLGERRVAEPAKVDGLIAGARDYYASVYADVLALHAQRRGTPTVVDAADGTAYRQQPPSAAARRRTERFLATSRRRGMLRWPKYLLTVDGWLQIQLDKLERYHGIELQLSARERRYPLIFGWPRFFELLRRGIIK